MRRALFLWLLYSILATLSAACPTVSLQLGNCTVPGTNVDSWGFMFTFSSPSQSVCIVPSTVVNSTLLLSSDYCQNYTNGTADQCESLSGNTFNISAAGTSYTSSNPSTTLGWNPVWHDISPTTLLAGTALLQLTADFRIPEYPVGIITTGVEQNVGHLGLATNSQFLQYALDSGLIAQNGFGLNAGSQSVANPRPGGLVLGGYDQACIGGPFRNYTIGAASSSERQCPLQVTMSQLAIRYPLSVGSTDVVLSSDGIDIPACVEP
jgi:hypothetical protein